MTTFTGAGGGSGGTGRLQSFIDRDSHFNGTHSTPNDLFIEGHFEGTIECAGALFLAETADVNAHVTAGSLSVAGHLQGEIACRGRFEMLATSRVEARVQAGTIVVQEGARYEGDLRMGGVEPAGSEPGSTRRPEPRPARRAVTGDSPEVPAFSASAGRINGRPIEGADAGSSARPGPTAPPEA